MTRKLMNVALVLIICCAIKYLNIFMALIALFSGAAMVSGMQ